MPPKWYRDAKFNFYLRYKYAWLGLRQSGYFQAHRRAGLNRWNGPWINLSSSTLFADYLRASDRVLEFGAGNGTYWLANRCEAVLALEADQSFMEAFFDTPLPPHTQVRHIDPPDDFAMQREIDKCQSGDDLWAVARSYTDHAYFRPLYDDGPFDVVVVDGRARNVAALLAYDALSPGGMMVFDNMDRRRYVPAVDALKQAEALIIPVSGIAPFNDLLMLTGFVFKGPQRLRDVAVVPRDY